MALGVYLLSPCRLSLFLFSYWFLKAVTTKHWPRTGMPFSQVLGRQKLDTLYLCSAFPLLSFIWATPKPKCGVCCLPACSAQRRKWRVLVPILHLRSSLGKEAPLHLLLFAVTDITSFPAQSVRVSCHSVKILLLLGGICWREGGRKGRGQDRVGEGRRGRCMSIKPASLKMRGPAGEVLSARVSDHSAFICLLTAISKWTEACRTEVPLFSKQMDFTFLFELAKEGKVQPVAP